MLNIFNLTRDSYNSDYLISEIHGYETVVWGGSQDLVVPKAASTVLSSRVLLAAT